MLKVCTLGSLAYGVRWHAKSCHGGKTTIRPPSLPHGKTFGVPGLPVGEQVQCRNMSYLCCFGLLCYAAGASNLHDGITHIRAPVASQKLPGRPKDDTSTQFAPLEVLRCPWAPRRRASPTSEHGLPLLFYLFIFSYLCFKFARWGHSLTGSGGTPIIARGAKRRYVHPFCPSGRLWASQGPL